MRTTQGVVRQPKGLCTGQPRSTVRPPRSAASRNSTQQQPEVEHSKRCQLQAKGRCQIGAKTTPEKTWHRPPHQAESQRAPPAERRTPRMASQTGHHAPSTPPKNLQPFVVPAAARTAQPAKPAPHHLVVSHSGASEAKPSGHATTVRGQRHAGPQSKHLLSLERRPLSLAAARPQSKDIATPALKASIFVVSHPSVRGQAQQPRGHRPRTEPRRGCLALQHDLPTPQP